MEAENLTHEAIRICLEEGGPYLYEDALNSDLLLIGQLLKTVEQKDYNTLAELLRKPVFARLSAKKAENVEHAKKKSRSGSCEERSRGFWKSWEAGISSEPKSSIWSCCTS